MPHSSHPELQYQIALTMAPAIGPIKARALIKFLGSAEAVFLEKKEILMKIDGIGSRLSDSIASDRLLEEAEKEMEFMSRHRINALYFQDPEYPYRLKECEDAPIILYTRGEEGLHCQQSLSVVGTRRATSYGRDMCREIIKGLSELTGDLVVVSGLAFGIDVIAHRAALEYGLPTVAVLGHGMSTIYPRSHRDTAKRIIEQGGLVTDFHSKMGPERNNFLRRNRIIAGLSQATLVIESAKTGGALITAGMAFSYHREVLAVPGRAGDEKSKGCNGLIQKDMAALVESPRDIIDRLNWEKRSLPAKQIQAREISPSPDEKKILRLIQDIPGIEPGAIGSNTGLPVHGVLAQLMEMELKGWIAVEPGNRYRSKVNLS